MLYQSVRWEIEHLANVAEINYMEHILYERTFIMSLLAISTYFDIKFKKIPIILPIIWGVIGVVWNAGIKKLEIEQWIGVVCSVLIGCILLLFSFWSKDALGKGDALIFIVIGIFIDFYSNLLLLGTALFLSSFAAIYLLIIRRKNKKTNIPLIPFIYTAYAILCLVF